MLFSGKSRTAYKRVWQIVYDHIICQLLIDCQQRIGYNTVNTWNYDIDLTPAALKRKITNNSLSINRVHACVPQQPLAPPPPLGIHTNRNADK